MRAAGIYLVQCGEAALYAFSIDRTGCNLPRAVCREGWVLRAQLKPADLVEEKYAALVRNEGTGRQSGGSACWKTCRGTGLAEPISSAD
jgi:hypothetical protein